MALHFDDLSTEQQAVITTACLRQRDVVVDATVGSGKSSTIAVLCNEAFNSGLYTNILYLTYSKLLKEEAMKKVEHAKVTNYHGFVYPYIHRNNIQTYGFNESIEKFNQYFNTFSPQLPQYDMLVIDEYQDINEDYAQVIRNIKSVNPAMRVVMVGDKQQKIQRNSRIDIDAFVEEITDNPAYLPFTQSFRIGPEIADSLAQAWKKTITGANTDQKVLYLSEAQAQERMANTDVKDLLVLGSKSSHSIQRTLNFLEHNHSERFNKNTVHVKLDAASTRGNYSDDVAVFTTFDSAKGMERHSVYVYDFNPNYWKSRTDHINTGYDIIRNLFLVAASRGKEEIIFVNSTKDSDEPLPLEHHLNLIPIETFTKLPDDKILNYKHPVSTGDCFTHKYAEDIAHATSLINKRLLSVPSNIINAPSHDGLINITPCLENYITMNYFDNIDGAHMNSRILYDGVDEPLVYEVYNEYQDRLLEKYDDNKNWTHALGLSSMSTKLSRYISQVTMQPHQMFDGAIKSRISTIIPQSAYIEKTSYIDIIMSNADRVENHVCIRSLSGIIHDGTFFNLIYDDNISNEHFLTTALSMYIHGYNSAILWNVRDNQAIELSLGDKHAFLNAVIKTLTMGAFTEVIHIVGRGVNDDFSDLASDVSALTLQSI